jgi:hypothetical protein
MPEQVQHQFKLKQWREIEDILVECEAADTISLPFSSGLRIRDTFGSRDLRL